MELVFCKTGKKVIIEKSDLYAHTKIIKLANKLSFPLCKVDSRSIVTL